MQVKGEHIAIIIITLILTRTVSHLGENCQGVKSVFHDYVNYIYVSYLRTQFFMLQLLEQKVRVKGKRLRVYCIPPHPYVTA